MADIDGLRDNNWDEAEIFIVLPEKAIPGPMDEAELKVMDKPDRSVCNVCNKIMVQVRCEVHLNAKGCNKCHLDKEHKA
jgi:hypothetical protein